MNDKFNEQKDTLISIKKEISLLHQQVDYLIRNEKPLELLDLDVMMNRTHTLYDLMCQVDLGTYGTEEDEELPMDPEVIRSVFGVSEESVEEKVEAAEEETEEPVEEEVEEPIEEDVEEPQPVSVIASAAKQTTNEEPIEEDVEEPQPVSVIASAAKQTTNEEPIEEPIEEDVEEPQPVSVIASAAKQTTSEEKAEDKEEPIEEPIEEDVEEPQPVSVIASAAKQTTSEEEVEDKEEPIEEPIEEEFEEPVEKKADDFGFILNFEPTEETTPSVFTSGDEIEMSIPQVETPIEDSEPRNEEPEPKEEEEIPYEPVIFGNMTEKEDAGFELDTPETLGEKLQQEEDHSLAAKLQHSTVNDLRKAIGINEKFLLVNELFSGSMEKYNKSIENLNDLKTLNGALIYLNELRIELQWNSNNEAYKKLLELVHRKYEA